MVELLLGYKPPDLSLKYILIQVHAPAGSAVRIKKKRPKGKIVLKKRPNRKKNGTKKQK